MNAQTAFAEEALVQWIADQLAENMPLILGDAVSHYVARHLAGVVKTALASSIDEWKPKDGQPGVDGTSLVYAGTFTAGLEYRMGDIVGWNGSTWICNVKKTDAEGKEPGEDATWHLLAHRGKPGKPGPRGPHITDVRLNGNALRFTDAIGGTFSVGIEPVIKAVSALVQPGKPGARAPALIEARVVGSELRFADEHGGIIKTSLEPLIPAIAEIVAERLAERDEGDDPDVVTVRRVHKLPYASGRNYKAGDLVARDDRLFLALRDSTNVIPAKDGVNWLQLS